MWSAEFVTCYARQSHFAIEVRRWLRRRQAIEPAIGLAKADHRMDQCWLKGADGDAVHAVLCAAGFNIRWLLRAVVKLGLAGLLLVLIAAAVYAATLHQQRAMSAGGSAG